MKKLILLITLSLGLTACHTAKESGNDKLIVGKWTLYKTIAFQNNDDSAAMFCNACPELTFVKNHSGFIKRPGKILFYFDWEFENDKLAIKQTDFKITDNVLADATYELKFAVKNQFQEATLSDSAKNVKYILRR